MVRQSTHNCRRLRSEGGDLSRAIISQAGEHDDADVMVLESSPRLRRLAIGRGAVVLTQKDKSRSEIVKRRFIGMRKRCGRMVFSVVMAASLGEACPRHPCSEELVLRGSA